MKDRFLYSLLYDFYGELLTDKQRDIFESYYAEDLSFQEIGENLSISKQAVSDMLKRTEKQLNKFEDKIGAVDKFLERRKSLKEALKLLDLGDNESVRNILSGLLEEGETGERI